MTERELKAVAEALAKQYYKDTLSESMKAKYSQEIYAKLYIADFEDEAQAAISASDSKYVKGLVEALKQIDALPHGDEELAIGIAFDALQNLPEDLQK